MDILCVRVFLKTFFDGSVDHIIYIEWALFIDCSLACGGRSIIKQAVSAKGGRCDPQEVGMRQPHGDLRAPLCQLKQQNRRQDLVIRLPRISV